jgi:uncharacterized membrane protein
VPDRLIIMRYSAYSSLRLARLVGLAIWVPLCIAVVMAPLLAILGATLPSLAIYTSLSPVCHQAPERSFAIGGAPWAVCQRCSGLYLGLAAACFAPGRLYTLIRSRRRASAMIGVLPALIDFCLNYIGIWTNTPSTRFATGFVLGLTLSALLVLGVAELIDRSEARLRSRSVPAFGGS